MTSLIFVDRISKKSSSAFDHKISQICSTNLKFLVIMIIFVFQGLKSWKHNFEITGDLALTSARFCARFRAKCIWLDEQVTQKVHQLGQLFGRVLRPQTHKGTCGATPLFRAQKLIIANKAQNQDFLTSIFR